MPEVGYYFLLLPALLGLGNVVAYVGGVCLSECVSVCVMAMQSIRDGIQDASGLSWPLCKISLWQMVQRDRSLCATRVG